MRVGYRTSRNSGVSVGPGTAVGMMTGGGFVVAAIYLFWIIVLSGLLGAARTAQTFASAARAAESPCRFVGLAT
jgi:hypothetical protein